MTTELVTADTKTFNLRAIATPTETGDDRELLSCVWEAAIFNCTTAIKSAGF